MGKRLPIVNVFSPHRTVLIALIVLHFTVFNKKGFSELIFAPFKDWKKCTEKKRGIPYSLACIEPHQKALKRQD